VNGRCAELQRAAIRLISATWTPPWKKKCIRPWSRRAIGQQRGLFFDETLQFIADYLANHPDPEVRAFQERHNRHVRKDLN
jgi:hypothetical protein